MKLSRSPDTLRRAWNFVVELSYRLQRAHEWGWFGAEKETTLIDGTTVPRGTYVMGRRVNGRWEYRSCTPEELENAMWMDAIR